MHINARTMRGAHSIDCSLNLSQLGAQLVLQVFTDSQVPASGHRLSWWVTHHVTPCVSQKHLCRQPGCLLKAAAAAQKCCRESEE